MACLKCGGKTSREVSFCEDCQAVMRQYPVKPGTPVHIPHRESPERRAVALREPTAAEQLSRLRGVIRWLYVLIALLSLLLCAAGIMLIRTLDSPPDPATGKNYTTVTPRQS